eukprot:2902154-Amphidinium_carterae.1
MPARSYPLLCTMSRVWVLLEFELAASAEAGCKVDRLDSGKILKQNSSSFCGVHQMHCDRQGAPRPQ